MAKIIRQWMARPLFVYLLGLFYLVYRTSLFFSSFEPLTFVLLFAAYCSITYLLLFSFKKAGLKNDAWFFTFFFWLIVLFILEINGILFNAFRFIISVKYLIAAYIIVLLIRIFTKKRISDHFLSSFSKVVNLFLLILSVFVLINSIAPYQKEKIHAHFLKGKQVNLNNSEKRNKDIIWILLDEYGSPWALKSQFNFDDFLTDSLRERGFYVYDSLKSRNDTTIYSLSSIFNSDDSLSITNIMYADSYLQQSNLAEAFGKINYEFDCFDFLRIHTQTAFAPLPTIYPLSYYEQMMNNTLIAYFFSLRHPNAKFDAFNQKIIQQLSYDVAQQSAKPRFIWAHLLIPHDPYCRDANGNFSAQTINPSDSAKSVSGYLQYLNYGNKVVLDLLKKIPDIKNKTIIISGDHGFRFPCLGDRNPIRKKTFTAIYFPGMDTGELKQIKFLQQIPLYLRY
jgi:hypothetical protein